MDRRRSPRVNVVLPVRIWGVDAHSLPFIQQATVRNISADGAVVQGIKRRVKPGEILEMQYDNGRAQFRVVWVGDFGSPEQHEIGLQALPDEHSLWDINLPWCCEMVAQG
jgi:PilZ domain